MSISFEVSILLLASALGATETTARVSLKGRLPLTLEYDRELKAPLYATHAIPELWVVDVTEKVLWIYRDPQGGRYTRMDKTERPGKLLLAAAPDIEVDLSGLFS